MEGGDQREAREQRDQMDEIVEQIVKATGVEQAAVSRAVAIIIAFVAREAPAAVTQPMLQKINGAGAIAANGAVSGGLFGVFNALTSAGLSLAEIQSVVMAFVAAAKLKVGDREVNAVVAAIPGLSQFI